MLTFIPATPVGVHALLHHSPLALTPRHRPATPPAGTRRFARASPACISDPDRFQREEQRKGFQRNATNPTKADTHPALTPGFAQTVVTPDGREISYDYVRGDKTPTILFLPKFFFSRWRQAKANAMEIFAKRRGQAIVVEEYLGTGERGDFATDGTLTQWIEDTCALVDCIKGPVILVGAGIGGWIMLHVATRRPHRVIGLVGISPSVDFTTDLIGPSLTPEQRAAMEKEGMVEKQWGNVMYPISKRLMDDGEQWCVLSGGTDSLDVNCPVRLVQGMDDEEIPADRILRLVDVLQTDDCIVSFIKKGDHFLEDEAGLRRTWDAVCDITDNFYEYDLTSPTSG